MKGITPVIAIILLLLITISMVGFAFVWFSRVQQTSSQQIERQLQADIDRAAKKVAIEVLVPSTTDVAGSVMLRNIGTVATKAGELKLYVNGTAAAGCDTLALAVGATGSCAIIVQKCDADSGVAVRVTAPGGQDETIC
ncbi:MAG: hypothetical protein QMD85_05335 [Candidatus Aenigmarchaeota archaeon]|nr:hypothetical protein [Candidatus Aenigmarchaeota archaeon]MDI6722990.1 hypothetical protein [Candidatus Aenigmarchaeota archaeon]